MTPISSQGHPHHLASGTMGVKVEITTTNAMFGSKVLRAAAGGAAKGGDPRGVIVSMS